VVERTFFHVVEVGAAELLAVLVLGDEEAAGAVWQ